MTRESLSDAIRDIAGLPGYPSHLGYDLDALQLVGILPDSAIDGFRVAESDSHLILVWANPAGTAVISFRTTGYSGFDVAVSAPGSDDFVTDRFFAGGDGAAEKLARLFAAAQRSS